MKMNTCSLCGNQYEAQRLLKKGFCPACKKEATRLNNKTWREQIRKNPPQPLENAVKHGAISLTVIYDPLDVGGFAPGTRFDKVTLLAMIRLMNFTRGTILQDHRGRMYEANYG